MKTLIALLMLCSAAQAGDFALGLGVSVFDKQPNGIWYQKGLPETWENRSPSATIRYDFSRDFSIGYQYTGHVTSHALVKADEPHYWQNLSYPLSNLYGSGRSEGFFATGRYGDNFYLTYGAMVYRSTWDVYIPDHYDSATSLPRPANYHHKPNWRVMPMGGVGYRKGDYSFEMNTLPVRCFGDEYPAIYQNYALNLSVLRRF